MKSFNTIYTNIQNVTKNTTATAVTQYKDWINETHHLINSMKDWAYLETTRNITTVASTEAYDLPEDCRKVMDVYLTVGTQVYLLQPIEQAEKYSYYKALNLSSSDVPQVYYIDYDTIRIFPATASASNTLTIRYRRKTKDMTADDYTTGTVTLTNADETVTGSGTTFTAPMAGRWLRSSTTGDYKWYEIDTFTSATALELRKKYNGTTTAGLSYTIGEMPLIPEPFHSLLEYRPLYLYYVQNENMAKAREYEKLYKEMLADLIREQGSKSEANPETITDLHPNFNINDESNFRNPSGF